MNLLRNRARRAAVVAAALLLGGCGGGVWVGIGDGFDDEPPAVSITASSTSAPAGASLTLSAAAADENGIDEVVFYRIESGGQAQRLGSVLRPPYEWALVVPADRDVLHVFARAFDGTGQFGDSATLAITVTR